MIEWAAEDLADKIPANRAALKCTTDLTTWSHQISLVACGLGAMAALAAWLIWS